MNPCQKAFRSGLFGILSLLGLASALPLTAEDYRALPTLAVIGYSTAANSKDLGWGSHLAKYFDSSKVRVINRARGGRSSRTFLYRTRSSLK